MQSNGAPAEGATMLPVAMRLDLIAAVRGLLRHPSHTVMAILTLAIGTASASTIAAVVDAYLLRVPPYPDADRVVIISTTRGGVTGRISAEEVRELRRDATTLQDVASFRPAWYTASGDAQPEVFRAAMSSFNIFRALGVAPQIGTGWPESDDGTRQFKVVISDRLWRNRYRADPGIVGRTIQLDVYAYEVLGVMPPGFEFPLGTDVWRRANAADFESRGTRTANAVARLKPGVSLAAAQADLDALAVRYADAYPATNQGVSFSVRPLRDFWIGALRPYLVALSVAAALALALAMLNVVHLVLVRATARYGEFAVRTALGGSLWRVRRVVIVEGAIVGAVAGILGLVLAPVSLRALQSRVSWEHPAWMLPTVEARVGVACLLLALIAGALAGTVAVRRATRGSLGATMKAGGGRGAVGRGQGRPMIMTTQLVLGASLVLGALAVTRAVRTMQATDPGFDPTGVMMVKVDPPWTQYNTVANTAPYYRKVLEALARTPGVLAVGTNDAMPYATQDVEAVAHRQLPVLEGQDAVAAATNPFVNLQLVSPSYFDAMRVPLLAGRAFTAGDTLGSRPVALVSRAAATRLWPGQDPIGRRLAMGTLDANYRPSASGLIDTATTWHEVVGVTGDVRWEGDGRDAGLDLYISHEQLFAPETWILARVNGSPAAFARRMRDAVQQVDPLMSTFDVMPLGARIERTQWRARLTMTLIGVLALLTTLLAVIGAYGVIACQVNLRTPEFGVRLALGEAPRALARGIVTTAARTGLVGGALGVLVAVAGVWVLNRFASVGTLGVRDAVVVVVAAVAVSVAAALAPARRAAMADPLLAMRGS